MGSQWHQLKPVIVITALVSLYGIASLMVVVLGPSLGLGLTGQIAIIALILLTLPIAILVKHYRKKRQEKEPAAAKGSGARASSKRQGSPTGLSAPTGIYDELTRGVEEIVQWLRHTKLSASKAGDAVYSLPWFLIAGHPQSGKTSLLLSSGLDFHALPSQRRADQNIVRPTRDCEWRVTDWAVLADTAGRYQIEGGDSDEWSALIETIKKYRKNRPLDGLLITANAAGISAASDVDIERQAKVLRERLDEVIERAGTRFPVYLVFTQTDLIEGFEDFFGRLDAMERAQVWGATIPLDQSENAHALFDVEFDYLYEALMRHRLLRLSESGPPDEQLRVFDFPLRFAEARRKLGLFTSALFRPNPFSERPLLRGFYFTSGAANGGPSQRSEEVQVAGEGYFTENLFKDVLLRDKDLAKSFQAGTENTHLLRDVLVGVAAAFLLLTTIGVVVSFANNMSLIGDARKLGGRVDRITTADAGEDPTGKNPAAARDELEAVDGLRAVLVKLDEHDSDWPPLYLDSLFYRFGLYSGNSLSPYLRAVYFESINRRFFEPAAASLEVELKSFAPGSSNSSGAQPDAAEDKLGDYYDLLKAYLMLSLPDKVEPSFLSNQLAEHWNAASLQDMEAVSQRQLDFYASQAHREDVPHIKSDPGLIEEARNHLAAYPAVNRYYKRATTEIAAKIPSLTLDIVLNGKTGVLEGSHRVPGSFTIDGYQQMQDAIQAAPQEMSKDDWVMGGAAVPAKDQGADIGKLKATYSQDYVNQWREFIKGIKVKDFKSQEEAVDAMKTLAASNSPLVKVMNEVARQTNPSGGGASFWSKIFGGKKEDANGTEVEKEFAPLIQFVSDGEKDADPKSQYLKTLSDVRDALNSASGDQWAQTSKAVLTGKDTIGLQKAEQNIKGLLEGFDNTAASSEAAKLLMQPIDNLRALLTGERVDQIEREWREQIYPKARSLESGFPFTATGDASVDDLARYLNPIDGQLTVFFNEMLKSSFDDVQGQWKLKPSGGVKFSDDFVNYLNKARRLREGLFSKGAKQPEFSYGVTLQPATGVDASLEIDGQMITRSAPSATLKWPKQEGSSGATIEVLQAGAEAQKRSFSGTWGLFKMLAAGNPTRTADNQYLLVWKAGPASVQAKIQPPSSTNNPFDFSLFKEFRAPQSTR